MAFVIAGHQRSGTSLLRDLCNTHPDIWTSSEFGNYLEVGRPRTRYFLRLCKRWGGIGWRHWPLIRKPAAARNYSRVLIQNHCFVTRYSYQLLLTGRNSVDVDAIETATRKLVGDYPIIGDKYPEYIFELESLTGLKRLVILVIYRDCRDVVSSALETFHRARYAMPFFTRRLDSAAKVARRWVRSMVAMQQHCDGLVAVSYEELIHRPQQALYSVAEALQVDPAGFDCSLVRTDRIGRHRPHLSPSDLETIEQIAGPTLQKMGYN